MDLRVDGWKSWKSGRADSNAHCNSDALLAIVSHPGILGGEYLCQLPKSAEIALNRISVDLLHYIDIVLQ